MRNFQSQLSRMEAADTQVLGVSIDSPFSNHAFAQQNGVTFPLLSDMGGNVIQKFGLLSERNVGGVPMKSARRATFLIDKTGKIIEESVDNEAIDPTKIVDACERTTKTNR